MIEKFITSMESKADEIVAGGVLNGVDKEQIEETRRLFDIQKDLHSIIRQLEELRISSSFVANHTVGLMSVLNAVSVAFVDRITLEKLYDTVYSIHTEVREQDNTTTINGKGEEIVKEFES